MRIVLIGAGNVATHLGKRLIEKGEEIIQIYSRTEESASRLSSKLKCEYTCDIQSIDKDADMYICALKDSALQELIPSIVNSNSSSIFVHTAGSLPMDLWKEYAKRFGVLYPMQTFSINKIVDFEKVSFFVEGSDKSVAAVLYDLAFKLSGHVYEISSEQRKYLHIAAVFACNFANHMYTISKDILQKEGIPFDVMLPLIDETTDKIHKISPEKAQTGPAVRYDTNVMNSHLQMLSQNEEIKDIYEKISSSIYKRSKL